MGRVLVALVFVWSGYGKITGLEGTIGYIASKGLPLPQLLAIGVIFVELGGGILLIFEWKARWVASMLLLLTALVAVLKNSRCRTW